MKHVSENNKYTLNDYSNDAVGCISLSTIAEYSSPVHQPLIFKSYMSVRPLHRRPIRTYGNKHTLNKRNNVSKRLSMKSNSFIDLFRKEI